MSASLVGSEMCIRDRSSGDSRRCAIRYCARNSTLPPRCIVQRRPSGTVSYTHLTLPTICSV
eukprot:7808772-Alexandrium_andersonii.AAC.1